MLNAVTRLVAGAAIAWPTSVWTQDRVPLTELIPVGAITAEVLQPLAHPDYQVLGAKLQSAARANPEWFIQYAAAAPPGEPLPYHQNLGLTEPEYARLLLLADSISLGVAGKVSLTFAKTGSTVELRSVDLPALNGVRFDLSTGALQTALSTMAKPEEMRVDDGAAMGPWDGWRWYRSEGDALAGGDAEEESLSVGTIRASRLRMLSYRVRQISQGAMIARVDLVLRF